MDFERWRPVKNGFRTMTFSRIKEKWRPAKNGFWTKTSGEKWISNDDIFTKKGEQRQPRPRKTTTHDNRCRPENSCVLSLFQFPRKPTAAFFLSVYFLRFFAWGVGRKFSLKRGVLVPLWSFVILRRGSFGPSEEFLTLVADQGRLFFPLSLLFAFAT